MVSPVTAALAATFRRGHPRELLPEETVAIVRGCLASGQERLGVETPIAREVRGVLIQGVSPQDAVAALMLRRLKREVH